jgi:phosphatidylserine/phosphatidylglycerophosphate/cardiolipin synthase-like enzyme
MILDKNRVITGSYNFSKNAEEDNDENLLIFYSAAIARAFQQEFNALIVP